MKLQSEFSNIISIIKFMICLNAKQIKILITKKPCQIVRTCFSDVMQVTTGKNQSQIFLTNLGKPVLII
jgi:hypothetical protein